MENKAAWSTKKVNVKSIVIVNTLMLLFTSRDHQVVKVLSEIKVKLERRYVSWPYVGPIAKLSGRAGFGHTYIMLLTSDERFTE